MLAITKPLEFRYYNTLHGFQQPSDHNIAIGYIAEFHPEAPPHDRFVELKSSDWPKHISAIKQKEPGIEIAIDDFIGHVYLKTDRAHRSQIPRIVNACVAAGYSIKLLTRLETSFRPDDKSNLPYTIENSERIAIRQIEEALHQFSISDARKELLADERLWKTEEGKCFARKLLSKITDVDLLKRIRTKVYLPEHPDLDPLIDFPLKTLQEVMDESVTVEEEERPRKLPSPTKEEKNETEECTVCCDQIANTLVLPCNHSVVCKTCSDNLRATNDNAICLRCRRRIDTVLWDGGVEFKT